MIKAGRGPRKPLEFPKEPVLPGIEVTRITMHKWREVDREWREAERAAHQRVMEPIVQAERRQRKASK